MKDAVMAAVMDLAKDHPEIVMLDADLMSCLGSDCFLNAYPERFFNCGIAEANMVGVAAGLSSMGLFPIAHSFGCFSSRRAYDQLFLSVGYARQRIGLIGSDPGITAQLNGGTHMPFEDIALVRQVPGIVIIEPSDARSCYDLVVQAFESGSSFYLRVPRKGADHRYTDRTGIRLGKGEVLREGGDLTIVATGIPLVSEAEKACAMLAAQGIATTLVDLHTIRPLDTELIERCAQETGRMLVCENGRYAGGIGEAVAAHLARTNPTRMDFVNVGERYGEVGKLGYLQQAFGFTAEAIAAKAAALVG
jgi:transketolase